MQILPAKEIKSLPFYKGYLLPIIDKVIDDSSCGTIRMGQSKSGTYLFILHNSGFGYIDTDGELGDALQALQYEIVNGLNLPQYFHIYSFNEININKIDKKHFNYKLRKRIRFLHNEISNINHKFANDKYNLRATIPPCNIVAPFAGIIKPFWKSWHSFNNDSIVSWLCDNDGTPVSFCYAAVIANGVAEVDVFTVESYRGLGLAKLVTNHFIEQAFQKNLKVSWDCFEDNLASSQLAKEIGFYQTFEINFLSLFKKNKPNNT